jgi:hypothetical protein
MRSGGLGRYAVIVAGLLATISVAQGGTAAGAQAGSYDVVACNSAPGYVNNAWSLVRSGSSYGRVECPAGAGIEAFASAGSCEGDTGAATLVSTNAFSPLTTSSCRWNPGGEAKWVFTAPAGTTLQSFAGTWRCYSSHYTHYSWWLSSPHGGSGSGTCSSSSFTPVSRSFNAGATTLELGVRFPTCLMTEPGCTGHYLRAALAVARTTVRDDQAPTLTVTGGSIPAGGWHAHTADIRFDAADNVGIRQATLSVDGTEKARRDYQCDFTRPAPCSNQPNQTVSFDTGGLSEGIHDARLTIVDAAGNETHYDRELKVDRSPPTVTLSDDLASLDFDESGRDLYNLHIEANDEGSGIADARVRIDGAEVHSAVTPADCGPGACSLTTDFLLDTDTLAEGEHTIEATVADKSGRTFHRGWTIRVPGPGHFESRLAAWKADVERRVDDASPLALTRPMPAPPDRWRQPASCEVSEEAVRECFAAGRTWGTDVRNWLAENLATTTGSASTLPDVPLFEYARPELARHLVLGLREEFAVARRAVADPAEAVRVAISFNRPVDKAHVEQLFSGLDLQEQAAIRGIYDPSAAAISGGLSVPSPVSLTQLIDGYYADQHELANEQIVDLNTALEDPDPSDPEEAEDVQQAITNFTAYRDHLVAGGPVIKGIAVRISLDALVAAVEQQSSDIKLVQLLATDTSLTLGGGDALDSIPTDAESAVASGSAGIASSTSGVQETASSTRYPTCDDRGESEDKVSGTQPRNYMPNRWSGMNVFPYGPADPEGDRYKRNAAQFRWQLGGTLSWYCGDDAGDRGFEPDMKVYPNRPRWSTDWPDPGIGVRWMTDLPRPYVDDLADGTPPNPYETQEYPDFAMGTGHARLLRYRWVYSSRFTTNQGETNDGTVVFRGQNTIRPYNAFSWAFCIDRQRRPGSCYFAEHTTCLKYRSVSDPSTGLRVDWRARPDDNPLCHNPTN